MKTSWNNVRLIEDYLECKLSPAERLKFEIMLLESPALRIDLFFQRKIYQLVKIYHRKKQKEELETIHRRIFGDPGNVVFQQRIYQLFK